MYSLNYFIVTFPIFSVTELNFHLSTISISPIHMIFMPLYFYVIMFTLNGIKFGENVLKKCESLVLRKATRLFLREMVRCVSQKFHILSGSKIIRDWNFRANCFYFFIAQGGGFCCNVFLESLLNVFVYCQWHSCSDKMTYAVWRVRSTAAWLFG